MDLSIQTTTVVAENRSWLANAVGVLNLTGTLDYSGFTLADHFPDGFITSGIVLGQLNAAPGLWVPYDNAGVAGEQVARGILYTSIDVENRTSDPTAAIMYRGNINSLGLPTAGAMTDGGWNAAAAVDLTGIEDLDS